MDPLPLVFPPKDGRHIANDPIVQIILQFSRIAAFRSELLGSVLDTNWPALKDRYSFDAQAEGVSLELIWLINLGYMACHTADLQRLKEQMKLPLRDEDVVLADPDVHMLIMAAHVVAVACSLPVRSEAFGLAAEKFAAGTAVQLNERHALRPRTTFGLHGVRLAPRLPSLLQWDDIINKVAGRLTNGGFPGSFD